MSRITDIEMGVDAPYETNSKGSQEIHVLKLPSVYEGDIPFLTLYDGEEIVGKLWGKGGVLSFEGDAEESAKVFFDEVIRLNKHLLEPPAMKPPIEETISALKKIESIDCTEDVWETIEAAIEDLEQCI